MSEVVQKLKAISSQLNNKNTLEVPNINIDLDNAKNSKSAQFEIPIIPDFDIQSEDKPNKTINEDLPLKKKLINEMVERIFKEIDEEKSQELKNQNILNSLINNNINVTSREIHDWLLKDQEEPNFIFLLGYFNYFGIGINKNKKEAFVLFSN